MGVSAAAFINTVCDSRYKLQVDERSSTLLLSLLYQNGDSHMHKCCFAQTCVQSESA